MDIRVTQAHAETATERACMRDLSTKAGAEHLAKCIRTYWAARGVTVETEVVWVEASGTHGGAIGGVYGLKTKGIPVGRAAAGG